MRRLRIAGAAALVPLLASATAPPAKPMPAPVVGVRSLSPLPVAVGRTLSWGPPVASSTPVRLGWVLGAAHPAALQAYARAASMPGSPLFRRFLSPRQVARRFGPGRAVLAQDRRVLREFGFYDLARHGSILFATAPASVVGRVLGAPLRWARDGAGPLFAPEGRVRVPSSLHDITWVTGLVRAAPAGRPSHAPGAGAAVSVRPARVARMTAAPERVALTAGAGVTLAGGFTARSAAVGPASAPTGLPVTIRTTVTTPSGAGDTSAQIAGYTLAPPASLASVSQVQIDGPDGSGDLASTFTAYAPGTYHVTATVQTTPGAQAQSLALPAVTFTGAPAARGPFNAAELNAALGASALVAEAPLKPATIAVYATTTPNLADVSAFAQSNGLTPLVVASVAVDGGATPGTSDGGELSLDLESLAMAAPGAHVTVYDAPANPPGTVDTFLDMLNAVAAAGNVSVVSLSYAQPEVSGGDGTALRQAVEALNAEGITVVAGAGDNGAFGVAAGGATPAGVAASPADTPEVTAVGGVDLRVDAQGANGLATAYWGGETYAALTTTYLKRLVAKQDGSGNVLGGGGYSHLFAAPTWQAPLVAGAPGGESGGRGVPDLAMPASSDYPGLSVVLAGQHSVGGGTSMAAPLFAGYLADMAAQDGAGFGDLNPALYRAAAADPSLMTSALYGYDGRWTLASGAWNPLTGLGTPNIGQLAQDLAQMAPGAVAHVAASPSAPLTVAAGHSTALVFTATSSGGAPVAGATLSLSVTGSLSASGLAVKSAMTDASGRARVVFRAGDQAASGTVMATAADGARGATAALTVASPRVRALSFAAASGTTVAGQTVVLRVLTAVDPAGASLPAVPVQVAVAGPRTRTFHAMLPADGDLALRLVKTGRYRVQIALTAAPAVRATRHIRVLPGAPARYALHAPTAAAKGARLESRLFAYDAFGNVDTLVTGRVRFVWRVDGRRYAALAAFAGGTCVASVRLPADVGGAVAASYTVLSSKNRRS